MSFDDQTPTEYFGPDAVRWMHPDGRVLSLSPIQYRRAQRWVASLTSEQLWEYEEKRLGNPHHDGIIRVGRPYSFSLVPEGQGTGHIETIPHHVWKDDMKNVLEQNRMLRQNNQRARALMYCWMTIAGTSIAVHAINVLDWAGVL